MKKISRPRAARWLLENPAIADFRPSFIVIFQSFAMSHEFFSKQTD
jgi:hypothetical protein